MRSWGHPALLPCMSLSTMWPFPKAAWQEMPWLTSPGSCHSGRELPNLPKLPVPGSVPPSCHGRRLSGPLNPVGRLVAQRQPLMLSCSHGRHHGHLEGPPSLLARGPTAASEWPLLVIHGSYVLQSSHRPGVSRITPVLLGGLL